MLPHEEWLFKAQNDLDSAEYLLTSVKPFYDIVVYHAQQCAEKSLKAFLAFKEQEIEKVHNLLVLVNRCSMLDKEFDQLKSEALFLNPYATIYRYPEGDLLPSKKEVEQAMAAASKILDFVRNRTV